MGSSSRGTTVAAAVAAVLGLALVGALIWAFSLKSQRDDARADAAKAKAGLAAAGSAAANEAESAGTTEHRMRRAIDSERRRYRAARRRLGVDSTREGELEDTIDKRAQALRQADENVTDAEDSDRRVAAQLKRSKAQNAVAVACAQSFISTLDEFYGPHPDSQHAADRMLDRLERLQPRCAKVVGGDQ